MKKYLSILFLFAANATADVTLELDGAVFHLRDVRIVATSADPDCATANRAMVRDLEYEVLDAPKGRIYALRFTPYARGAIKVRTTGAFSHKLVTISKCPGDFRRDRVPLECTAESNDLDLHYSTGHLFHGCKLEPERAYFLNVKNGTERDRGYDTCADGLNCSFSVEHVEIQ